jgi:hypothetical protein
MAANVQPMRGKTFAGKMAISIKKRPAALAESF